MELKKIFTQLNRISYACKKCGNIENISELECAYCHKKGVVTFDKTKSYPVVCLNCRDKGMYVTCSNCKESVYHGTFKSSSLPIGLFVMTALVVGGVITYIFTR